MRQTNGGKLDPNLERMVRLYPNWEYVEIDQNRIGSLDWYLDPDDPNHISKVLTSNGTQRHVRDVARRYIDLGLDESSWPTAAKIEVMCRSLQKGSQFPPIVIVPKERYPDSPDSSFIDGVHRSLSAMVYNLRTHENVKLEALVGRKASLLTRVINRVR